MENMTKINKYNSFKFFLLKLAAFFIVIFIVDFVIGNMLKKFYFKQQSGYDYLTTYSIEETKADILILGSSRAVNIYDTKIFTNRFGLSCYNAGRYGESVFYHYAVLKSVLKRYTPKMIILSFDAGNFSKNEEVYDRLTVLLPYYKTHPEIQPIIALKGPYEKLKMVSSIYPYNSLLIPIITGNAAFNKKKYINENGFISIDKTFSGPLQTFDYAKEGEQDTIKINIFKSLLQECINTHIPLYIVCPPYMINPIGIDHSILAAKAIAKEFNIDFFDYSRDEYYINKPQLFADYRHLNKKGTELFSNAIIERIQGKTLNFEKIK